MSALRQAVLAFMFAVAIAPAAVAQRSLAVPASPGVPLSPGIPATPLKRSFTIEDLKAQMPQRKDGTFVMELSDILNTATDPEVQSLLTGQPVETTGQFMAESAGNDAGTLLRIFRSQLLCCAEHARLCSVAIQFEGKAPALKEKTWVKLTGILSYRREERKIVPWITVREFQEIPAPANPLLR